MTNQLDEGLLLQQLKRERESFSLGAERFRQKSTLSTFQQGFLSDFLEPLADAIKERREEIGKQRGKAQLSDFAIVALDEDDLALITLMTIMYTLSTSNKDIDKKGHEAEATFRRTAMKLGEQCRDQFFHEIDVETPLGNPELSVDSRLKVVLLARQTSNKWNASRRTQETLDAMKDTEWWNLARLIAVGAALIDLAIKSTGLFSKSLRALGGDFENADFDKKTAVLNLTPAGLNWLAKKQNERREHLHESGTMAIPINLPTVVQPKQWTALRGGGYFATPSVLVKKNGENFIADEHYDLEQMPEVLSAVNTLQNTPWRINAPVFEMYVRCWDNESVDVKKLFLSSDEKKLGSDKIASIESKIDLAVSLLDSPFYYPYQLDFRGRVYAVPQTINHQGDDFARALIEFAEPGPVDEITEYWTAIHLANVFGLNKYTMDKRYAWCNENQGAIEALVRDPLRQLDFWLKADERWGFLAAARAWVAIKNGAKESHLAVFIDGRCNGLQHLSAMSRDPHAAKAVNVISDGPPQDIYTEVAEKLTEMVDADNDPETEIFAKFWKDKIERSLVKKPVMTTPYGVTPEGIKRQMKVAARSHNPDGLSLSYLRDKVIDALAEAMKGPTDVKDWLQKVAKMMAKNEKPIMWTTPTGFRVVQDYRKPEFKRLVTKSYSVRYYLPVNGTRPVNKSKQELGIIANFVHSMDAAHLIKVVNALEAAGVKDIAVVHDSYGVHAKNVPLMNMLIRQQFLEIYKQPVLEQFIDEQIDRTGIDLPAFEKYGELDIDKVLESEYFFS